MSPNAPISAFSTRVPEAVNVLAAPVWERVRITFCYCSIFDLCWLSDWDVTKREDPTPVRGCPVNGRFGVPWSELDAAKATPR